VEKVDSDLVKRGRDGQLQTVRYDAVNAMLLNEFLKEHRKVEELEATIAQLKSTVAEPLRTPTQPLVRSRSAHWPFGPARGSLRK
jgi:hypothetical protein